MVGRGVGSGDGIAVVGSGVGPKDGRLDGLKVGRDDGVKVGRNVGSSEG